MAGGIESAWATLESMIPEEVCARADARYVHAEQSYLLRCFGHEIIIQPGKREMRSLSPVTAPLLQKLKYFSELSILWYLTTARDVPLSGKLIRPSDLKAGQIFTVGSHVLPLDGLARRYGANVEGFLQRGRDLCGENAGLGDASLRLLPFPRVPVVIILWRECDEFPARIDLLFDSSCELHLPQDIVWATAMLSLLIMM